MCEYCENKEDVSNKVYEDGSKFSDTICKVFIENDDIFDCYCLKVKPVEYHNGEKYQFKEYAFPINFCPMCGRKLD